MVASTASNETIDIDNITVVNTGFEGWETTETVEIPYQEVVVVDTIVEVNENDLPTTTIPGETTTEAVLIEDTSSLPTTNITENNGTEYPVDISAALTDTDGSEVLSVTIEGVPTGAVLSEGTDNGNGTWSIDVPDGATSITDTLTIIVPEGTSEFDLDISATSTEVSTGDTNTVTASDDVVIDTENTNDTVELPTVSVDMELTEITVPTNSGSNGDGSSESGQGGFHGFGWMHGENNGWGNGDQNAPGNSGNNNNAENGNGNQHQHGNGGNGNHFGWGNGNNNSNDNSESEVPTTVTAIEVTGSTTEMTEGETVSLTITDGDGNSTTATATIDIDGNYSAYVSPEDLNTDTDLSITANVTNEAGSATDNETDLAPAEDDVYNYSDGTDMGDGVTIDNDSWNWDNEDNTSHTFKVENDSDSVDIGYSGLGNGETMVVEAFDAQGNSLGTTTVQGSETTTGRGWNTTTTESEGEVTIEAEGIDHVVVTENSNGWHKEFTVTSVEGHVDGSDEVMTAVLVDGVCEGVEYTTSSGDHGFTDSNGGYSFHEGDTITFNVGGVVLGEVSAEDAMSGQTFLQDIADVDRGDLNDEYLENMATFLQSVDTADSGDNIVITPEMHAALQDADIDLRTASEEEVQDLVESVGGTYVDEDAAMDHVQEMLEEYAGMESHEFDEHIDDSLQTATFGTNGTEGITYETSSGETGVTGTDGAFTYNEGDTITFTDAEGNVISTIDASDIGSDSLITMEELVAVTDTVDTEIDETITDDMDVVEESDVADESDETEDEFDLDFDESTIAGFDDSEVTLVAQETEEVAVEEDVVQEEISESSESSVLDNEAFDLDFDSLEDDVLIDEDIDEVDSTETELFMGDVMDTSGMDSDINTDFFDAPEASALDTNIPTEDIVAQEASDFVSGNSGIEEVQVMLDNHVQVDQS